MQPKAAGVEIRVSLADVRVYVSADFALPRDLDPDDQIALALDFAEALTEREVLPPLLDALSLNHGGAFNANDRMRAMWYPHAASHGTPHQHPHRAL